MWTRTQHGHEDLSGLVVHSDAGSQYTSIGFTERLAQAGVAPSVRSVGDAYGLGVGHPRSPDMPE